MKEEKIINTVTLCDWLNKGQAVNIIDIRLPAERMEWKIPGSIHLNFYSRLQQKDPTTFDLISLDKTIPVVAVCTGGNMSLTAAEFLAEKGYDAYSLEGGMKAWTMAWNVAELSFSNYKIIQFRRTGKGCLSYIIISGNDAIVVDASLDVSVYESYLKSNSCTLKCVLETHIHADHLSRSKQLAQNNSASLHLPVPNKVAFDYTPVTENTRFKLGAIFITAIKTPGHTIESTCYLVNSEVLLTGDTLFIQGVGRPDLKGGREEVREMSNMLYESLQKLLALSEGIIILPAHSGEPIDFDNKVISTTIRKVRQTTALLQLNESDFAKTILQRIPPKPTNYLAIVEKNLLGDFSDINSVDLEAGANRCAIS